MDNDLLDKAFHWDSILGKPQPEPEAPDYLTREMVQRGIEAFSRSASSETDRQEIEAYLQRIVDRFSKPE